MLLALHNVSISYNRQTVVKEADFCLQAGKIGCLLGLSGCGKTTLLRAIAGFEPLSSGRIVLDGRVISTPDYHLASQARHIGFVFQDYSLFAHLNVADNIGFGLYQLAPEVRARRIDEMLELIDLVAWKKAFPHELSGGQQQRIALARSLAPRPHLLLLDEPFSSLDVLLREKLAQEVRAILQAQRMTALMVTHDQHEAFAIADQIGVMQHGRIVQSGTPEQLYFTPANAFVADFIGEGTRLPGVALACGKVQTEVGILTARMGQIAGQTVEVLIRPEMVSRDAQSSCQAQVVGRVFRGSYTLYTLQLDSCHRLYACWSSQWVHHVGERVGIKIEKWLPAVLI